MKVDDAAAGLDAVARVRADLADRARWSLLRHAAFGIVMGGIVAGWALPGRWPLVVVGLCLAATALIAARDRQRDGMFISGYQRGKTRPVTLTIIVVSLSALFAAVFLRSRMGLVWAPALLGLMTFAFSTGASIIWEKRYRSQLVEQDH
jgi:hypothetical protein